MNLQQEEKDLVESLRQIQVEIGLDKDIETQNNPVLEKHIDKRIEELFPIENFYFFKIFDDTSGDEESVSKRNEIE